MPGWSIIDIVALRALNEDYRVQISCYNINYKALYMFQLAINGDWYKLTIMLMTAGTVYKVAKDDTQKLMILFTISEIHWVGRGISLAWGASAWVSHIWGIPVLSLEQLEACGHTTKPMQVHQDRSLEWDQRLGEAYIPSAWAAAIREGGWLVFISHFGLCDNSHDPMLT